MLVPQSMNLLPVADRSARVACEECRSVLGVMSGAIDEGLELVRQEGRPPRHGGGDGFRCGSLFVLAPPCQLGELDDTGEFAADDEGGCYVAVCISVYRLLWLWLSSMGRKS